MQKPQKDKVCAEFCARFPSYRTDIPNEERVGFMLNHPLIRSKLNEWIGADNKSQPELMSKTKKKQTSVNNQFIDTDEPNSTLPSPPTHSTNTNQYLKNPIKSKNQRELGNELFKNKKLHPSLEAYNEAVRFAPFYQPPPTSTQNDGKNNDAEELDTLLALSPANRSAVYFELGETFHEKSLADVDLALKYGYPDRLKSKLLLRKANIYVTSKQWSRAESIIEEIRKNDDPTAYKLNMDRVNALSDQIHKNISQPNNDKENDFPDLALFQNNENFENASTGVELTYSEDAKRFVVAATDLKKKEIVFNEVPFATVLLPQFYSTHCHNCHKMLEHSHFIPCKQCTQCKFCSEPCAKNAWNVYHKYECLSLDLLHSVGIAHLAVRIIFCAGLQNILVAVRKHDKLKDPKNISIFQKGLNSNYERVYSLLDHLVDMNPEDVFQYTLTAGLLTNWIANKTSFFEEQENKEEACQEGNYSETQVTVGASMLHHISQLICNAHAITDILCDVNVNKISLSTADESQQRIATAIYPSASMMNHSCEPNISFTFNNGRVLLVKLTKDVSKGQEIFNCYGPHWRRMSCHLRLESLDDQYFFKCKCFHCTEEFARNISFVDKFTSFKCDECEGPVPTPDGDNQFVSSCQTCGHEMDLHDQVLACTYTDRLVQDAEVLLGRGNVKQALDIFDTCEDQYNGFLYKYHSSFGQLADIIARCYAILGEFSKAADFVKKSLIYVEERFGIESFEYGREVKKYVDLRSQSNVVFDCQNDELNRLTELYKSILLDQ